MNDINTQLMLVMLKHGYCLKFVQMAGTKIYLSIGGPDFQSAKLVEDYSTAVGLAAYWLSETNGVTEGCKADIDKILYPEK